MLQRTQVEIFTNVFCLPFFAFELLRSLQEERSENVVSGYAERSSEETLKRTLRANFVELRHETVRKVS
jgi:hypothetical protein